MRESEFAQKKAGIESRSGGAQGNAAQKCRIGREGQVYHDEQLQRKKANVKNNSWHGEGLVQVDVAVFNDALEELHNENVFGSLFHEEVARWIRDATTTKKWQDGFVTQQTKWKHQAQKEDLPVKRRQNSEKKWRRVVQQVPQKLPVESGGNAIEIRVMRRIGVCHCRCCPPDANSKKQEKQCVKQEKGKRTETLTASNTATVMTPEPVRRNTECDTKTQRTQRRKKARWEGTQEPNSQEHRENSIEQLCSDSVRKKGGKAAKDDVHGSGQNEASAKPRKLAIPTGRNKSLKPAANILARKLLTRKERASQRDGSTKTTEEATQRQASRLGSREGNTEQG